MKRPRNFASDNNSGICPEAWTALEEANQNHAPGYGDDRWTKQAADLIREVFETDCEVFFVFNGTAANSLSLASTCRSYHSILCHENAHVEQDECGAPEFFSNGTKVQLVPGANGRMTPQGIESAVLKRTDLHFPKTRAVTLTQATELGTLYQPAQLQAIHRVAKKHELKIHMDGARFANAVAQLKVAPKEITWKAGVDILSFGCTKNGAPVGDAVVFFNHDLAHEFEWRCKQAGQLASKMRFIAAPMGSSLARGRMAAACGTREQNGGSFGPRHQPHPRTEANVSTASQWRICGTARSGNRGFASAWVALLHIYRGRRCTFDVFVGYDSRRRR